MWWVVCVGGAGGAGSADHGMMATARVQGRFRDHTDPFLVQDLPATVNDGGERGHPRLNFGFGPDTCLNAQDDGSGDRRKGLLATLQLHV